MESSPHNNGSSNFRSWAILITFCVIIIVWGIINFLTIKDKPRQWDFGVLPDTPSESIYSTSRPANKLSVAPAPQQIIPLPEAATKPAASQETGR